MERTTPQYVPQSSPMPLTSNRISSSENNFSDKKVEGTTSDRRRTTYDHRDVRSMFDSIAARYDILNHTLSCGLDIFWRKRALRLLQGEHPMLVLDLACGTGDFAIAATELKPKRIYAVDPSEQMLAIAKQKIARKNLDSLIECKSGKAELLEFADGSLDAVLVGFGVRNFSNLEQGLKEIRRVLRKNGTLIVLEFSHPKRFPMKQLYALYSRMVLPFFGGIVSGNRKAYEYLPGTITEFFDTLEFINLLKSTGYSSVEGFPQTFGIVTIYYAKN